MNRVTLGAFVTWHLTFPCSPYRWRLQLNTGRTAAGSRKWGKGDTHTGYIQTKYTVSNKNWVKKVQNEKNISYLLVVFSPKRELKTKEY